MAFPNELQGFLGFKLAGNVGHIFAQDPGTEIVRHYCGLEDRDDYRELRDKMHEERTGASRLEIRDFNLWTSKDLT